MNTFHYSNAERQDIKAILTTTGVRQIKSRPSPTGEFNGDPRSADPEVA